MSHNSTQPTALLDLTTRI